MHAHDVAGRAQVVQGPRRDAGRGDLRIGQERIPGGDAHAESSRERRDVAADRSEPQDAERPAPQLDPASPGPLPRAHTGIEDRDAARRGEREGDRHLGHRGRVRTGGARHRDTAGLRRVEVDVVDARPVARDEAEAIRAREGGGVEVVEPGDHRIHADEGVRDLVGGERPPDVVEDQLGVQIPQGCQCRMVAVRAQGGRRHQDPHAAPSAPGRLRVYCSR